MPSQQARVAALRRARGTVCGGTPPRGRLTRRSASHPRWQRAVQPPCAGARLAPPTHTSGLPRTCTMEPPTCGFQVYSPCPAQQRPAALQTAAMGRNKPRGAALAASGPTSQCTSTAHLPPHQAPSTAARAAHPLLAPGLALRSVPWAPGAIGKAPSPPTLPPPSAEWHPWSHSDLRPLIGCGQSGWRLRHQSRLSRAETAGTARGGAAPPRTAAAARGRHSSCRATGAASRHPRAGHRSVGI